jgi:nitroreductase
VQFSEVVRRRRMVRNFDPQRAVPREALDRILENALHAPSAGFSQGWAFVVLEGPEQVGGFWSTIAEPEWLGTDRGVTKAPVIVVPLSNRQAYLDRYAEPDKAGTAMHRADAWPVPYWDLDTGMASLLMLLTAVDEGLGALFFGIFRNEALLRERLGVPDDYRAVGAIAIGYPAPDTPSPSLARGRRPLREVVHRGRW